MNYDAARKFASCAIDLNEDRARGLLEQGGGAMVQVLSPRGQVP